MTTLENTGAETRADLIHCDREPVHLLGRIQPFDCLIAVTADWLVAYASRNTEAFTGFAADKIVDQPLVDIIRPEAVEALCDRLLVLIDYGRTERIDRLDVDGSGRLLDATMFVVDGLIVIELEPATSESQIEGALRQLGPSIAHLQRDPATSLRKLVRKESAADLADKEHRLHVEGVDVRFRTRSNCDDRSDGSRACNEQYKIWRAQ